MNGVELSTDVALLQRAIVALSAENKELRQWYAEGIGSISDERDEARAQLKAKHQLGHDVADAVIAAAERLKTKLDECC